MHNSGLRHTQASDEEEKSVANFLHHQRQRLAELSKKQRQTLKAEPWWRKSLSKHRKLQSASAPAGGYAQSDKKRGTGRKNTVALMKRPGRAKDRNSDLDEL